MSNAGSALAYFLMMQLVLWILLVAGGIYLLYCAGRAAAGIDRVANALEVLVAQGNLAPQNMASTPISSSQSFVPTNSVVAPSSASGSEL